METPEQSAPAVPTAAAPGEAPAAALPDRYVAYVFDDVNTTFTDLAQTREAAYRHIVTSLRPDERAGIFTTSGEGGVDFTLDREKLHKALAAIRPQNTIVQAGDCPPMTIYQADAIENGDTMSIGAAMADFKTCADRDANENSGEIEWRVLNFARAMMGLADRNLNTVFTTMNGLIQKLSLMSGQRTMVFVSSGFLVTTERRPDESAMLERAVRANIVVNSLDARSLYALPPGLDAAARTNNSTDVALPPIGDPMSGMANDPGLSGSSGSGPPTIIYKTRAARDEAFGNREVMAEFAANTGGRFFENSNDLQGGFARLATAPEYLYVLGFAPQDLKLDGKYHNLKVSLHNVKGIALEARRGYYAPRYSKDPAERSKEEIEEAFFSRAEIGGIPVSVHTQFFKTSDYEATLSVLAKIDVRQLQFRKEADRNRNDLTVVVGLFDSDGRYVKGTQKVLELRLRDETLKGAAGSGISVRNTFNVAPGTYFVRLVARDSEGESMATQMATVEIQ